MKKITFDFLLLFRCLHSVAQLNFCAGKIIYPVNAPGFQTFFQTYNSELTTAIKTPFKPDFPSANGFSVMTGYLLNRHDGAVGFP